MLKSHLRWVKLELFRAKPDQIFVLIHPGKEREEIFHAIFSSFLAASGSFVGSQFAWWMVLVSWFKCSWLLLGLYFWVIYVDTTLLFLLTYWWLQAAIYIRGWISEVHPIIRSSNTWIVLIYKPKPDLSCYSDHPLTYSRSWSFLYIRHKSKPKAVSFVVLTLGCRCAEGSTYTSRARLLFSSGTSN